MDYVHGGDIYTYKNMVDFSSNISPFGPGEKVMEAVQESAATIGAYPDSKCGRLRDALSEAEGIPKDSLVFGNGASDLIFSLAFADRPGKALLTAPSFSEYAQALKAADCKIVYHMLKEEENFCLTPRYLAELKEDLDMAFLCCPDNPAGQLIDRELLTDIIRKCGELKIRLILDECFCEFLENQKEVPAPSEILLAPWVFLIRAFTKMYAVPGLRLGYGITWDRAFIERLAAVRQPWSVSVTAQAAGLAALGEQKRVEMTRRYVYEERKMMEKELGKIGVKYFPSSANYMLLKSEYDLFELLKMKQLLIRDCSNYVGLCKGYYRIAVKKRGDNRKLLDALKEIYAEGAT